jgi:hypothetical protein
MKKLDSRGFSHDLLVVAFVVLFAIAGVAYLVASRAQSPSFTYLATHPQASQQPTALGKTIYALQAWNGKIYAGYGDYAANTGPIAITPFDPASNTFATTAEVSQQTEAIGLYRILNGKLFAASTDPQYGVSTDYAVGTAGSPNSWQQVGPSWPAPNNGVGMTHAFDMNSLTGTDLWLVGSQGNDPVAWRSTDGGITWVKSLDVAAPSGDYGRFYGAAVYNGKLYVQAMWIDNASNYVAGYESSSHVFDGSAWSKGPSLSSSIWHPESFAGKLVYSSWAAPDNDSATVLNAFDGTKTVSSGAPSSIWGYTVDGGTLYILGTDSNVYSTTDLVHWYQQASAPSTARSIAILNGVIYVGTNDSKLYSAPVNTSPTAVSGSGGTTTTKGNKGGNGKPHISKK